MGVVCFLPSLGICRIWLDITYVEQLGASCPVDQSVFFSPHESGYPVADFQTCWCQTFIKKWTNFSQPPAPSLVVPFHPALLAAGCGKGTTSRASLGSVALHVCILWLLFSTFMPVSVPRPSSDPEKEVASHWEWMSTILLWLELPQEDISCDWGPQRVLSSKLVERSFIISFTFFLKWPCIAYLLSLKNPE